MIEFAQTASVEQWAMLAKLVIVMGAPIVLPTVILCRMAWKSISPP